MKRISDIGLWEGAVPQEVCQNMIDFFDDSNPKPRDERAVKDEYIFLYDEMLRKQVAPFLRDCGDEYFGFYGHDTWRKQCAPITMKIQKAKAGEGYVGIHWEQGAGQLNANRFAAWMIYLNTVDRGGHTVFPLQSRKRFKPTQGDLLIWPAAYTHPHHSFPDLGESKYILTGWFSYKDTPAPIES